MAMGGKVIGRLGQIVITYVVIAVTVEYFFLASVHYSTNRNRLNSDGVGYNNNNTHFLQTHTWNYHNIKPITKENFIFNRNRSMDPQNTFAVLKNINIYKNRYQPNREKKSNFMDNDEKKQGNVPVHFDVLQTKLNTTKHKLKSIFQIDTLISHEVIRNRTVKNTKNVGINYLGKTSIDVMNQGRSQVARFVPSNQKEADYFHRRKRKVNPYHYGFVINGSSICDQNTDMVVVVHSHYTFRKKRDAIRQTWGSIAKGGQWPNRIITDNIKLAFIFGLHRATSPGMLETENAIHGDIIQGNFYDSYKNMTLKSLLGLKWAFTFCPNAKYLVKSDDDMFINLPSLINILHRRKLKRSIMGPHCSSSLALRRGKWALPMDTFPFRRYPPYEAGSAYVITSDIVRELFDTSQYVPSIFIDDVYITGILGAIIGVDHALEPGFAYWMTKKPHPCKIVQDQVVTIHKISAMLMRRLWQTIANVQC